jgi:hypothetical protein
MGMFDYVVNVPPELRSCPECGHQPINGWQSKDGPCVCGSIDVFEVSNFYTICEGCGEFVEYDGRKTGRFVRVLDRWTEHGPEE